MKNVEDTFRDQSRWDLYGRGSLEAIEDAPERFVVDPTKLTPRQSDFLTAMHDVRGRRILEYGSGRGRFSVILAKMGAIVTGVDIGPDLVELSKRTAEVNGVECDFVVGSVDRLPFDDGVFDFVVGNAVLHHLPRAAVGDAVREAHRVLTPDGVALFCEPIENSRVFNTVQNLFPAGRRGSSQYRPSLLQRGEWKAYLEKVDDRAMSDEELIAASGPFGEVEIAYHGMLVRLARLWRDARFREVLERIDVLLTDPRSPVRSLSQSVLVTYRK
jgi:SAM-dependent methyltransferase